MKENHGDAILLKKEHFILFGYIHGGENVEPQRFPVILKIVDIIRFKQRNAMMVQ